MVPDSLADANRALVNSDITNCRFVLGTQTLADAGFDAVFSTDTFEHVENLPGVFQELFRVLWPGGVVISR